MSIFDVNEEGKNEFLLKKVLLRKLPDNFKLDGTLNCSGSSITELPAGLIVNGDLILTDSHIMQLPSDAIIAGAVYCTNPAFEILEGAVAAHGVYNFGELVYKNDFTNKDFYKTDKFIWFQNELLVYSKSRTPVSPDLVNLYFDIFKHKELYEYKNQFHAYTTNAKERNYYSARWKAIERGVYLKYSDYTYDTVVTLDEARLLYCDFTGACGTGVDKWIENKLRIKKETYTIKEVIDLTKDSWRRAELISEFFENGHKFVL